MLDLVSFQTCSAYYLYFNKSDEIMEAHLKIVV